MQSIEQEIQSIQWRNDKGISSEDANLVSLLTALNEIADQLHGIRTKLDRLPERKASPQ